MPLASFDVTWTTDGAAYRFVSPDTLTLPDGKRFTMPVGAWLGLREVLRLLPDAPGAPVELPPGPTGPANRGRAWLPEEEERLRAAWTAGDDATEIARAIGRSRGAVMARLVRMGLVDEAEAGLRYPASATREARAPQPAEPG